MSFRLTLRPPASHCGLCVPQVYPNTTNPGVTTGDGMAIAHRAKAAMANMEFVQFHPTSLFQAGRPAGARSFLISEAVRGEGGLLFNQAGERFMFGWALCLTPYCPSAEPLVLHAASGVAHCAGWG
jgi:succinate dehydrogenase/fumarate reductase flavoprotein subunit